MTELITGDDPGPVATFMGSGMSYLGCANQHVVFSWLVQFGSVSKV